MSTPSDDPVAAPLPQNAKTSLRRELLAARRGAPADPGADLRRGQTLLSLPELQDARVVAGYLALRGEPDIGAVLELLRTRGTRVVLPVVTDNRDLDFRTADGTLVPAAEIDVVLAPAVAADRDGGRLGRGGGSYDRALVRVRADTLVVAIVHGNELVPAVPLEAHDLRVGAVLAGDHFIRVIR